MTLNLAYAIFTSPDGEIICSVGGDASTYFTLTVLCSAKHLRQVAAQMEQFNVTRFDDLKVDDSERPGEQKVRACFATDIQCGRLGIAITAARAMFLPSMLAPSTRYYYNHGTYQDDAVFTVETVEPDDRVYRVAMPTQPPALASKFGAKARGLAGVRRCLNLESNHALVQVTLMPGRDEADMVERFVKIYDDLTAA